MDKLPTTNKALIFSAPSGSGKSTIIRYLLERFPQLEFSISATSRSPRGEELDGVDYYFLSSDEFQSKIESNDFLEHEEVYKGTSYGTLHSETQRIWNKHHIIIFDVDVEGALRLKKILGSSALSIFIIPPSIEELRKRLQLRATDTTEAISKRIAKAQIEIEYAPKFDTRIINDTLEHTISQAITIVDEFILA